MSTLAVAPAEAPTYPSLRAAGVTRPHSARWARIVDQAERRAGHRTHDESLARAVHRQVVGLHLDEIEQDELAFYLNANYGTEWGADADEAGETEASADASADDTDDSSSALGWAGLVAGLLGLAAGGLALSRTRSSS